MKIEFKQADTTDAELLVEIYNASFYNDYMKYGECPAYGKTKEAMEKSIINYPKFLILCDGSPVGCVSCKKIEERGYENVSYELSYLVKFAKENNLPLRPSISNGVSIEESIIKMYDYYTTYYSVQIQFAHFP